MASDFFGIQKFQVQNNVNYSKDEIIALSGIQKDTNLFGFFLTRGRTAEKMQQDSYIEEVKLSVKLPRTVVIGVKERSEVAAVPIHDQYIWIDDQGYVLKSTEKEPKLTLLVGLTITSMEEGHKLDVKQSNVFDETLNLLITMEDSDIFFKKIDISDVVIKGYIYDKLICKGTPENILNSMETGNLQIILYDLYKKEIDRGTINVGEGKVCSFSPNIE